MKRRLAPGIGVVSVVALLVVGFILSWHYFGRLNPYESLMPDSQTSMAVPIQLDDVEVNTRSSGVPQWQVHAASLIVSSDRQNISANGLNDGVLYQNGTPALLFSANHVQYGIPKLYSTSNVSVDGGVQVNTAVRRDSATIPVSFQTEEVTWSGNTGIASCNDPVRFSAGNLGSGSAQGIEIDTQRKKILFQAFNVSSAAAQADVQTSAGTEQDAVKDSNLVTYGATQSGYWDENNRILTLNGIVTFHQGDAQVTMTGAVYDRNTNIATSNSLVTITDTDTTVTGDQGSINFTTHNAVLSGHIKMLVIPKPSDMDKDSEAKKPTTVLCDQITYDYRGKTAHTKGAVVIQQPGRTVTADEGDYDVKMKVITLAGNVIGKSTDGKVIQAPNAKVSVDPKDEWIELQGPVTGQLPLANDDNPLSPDAQKTPTPSIPKAAAPAALPIPAAT